MSDDNARTIESPLEDVFGIEPNSTLSTMQANTGMVVHDDEPTMAGDDEEDVAVTEQLGTVYDYAIESFESQHALTQTLDPKFSARNAEVAAQYLKIALDATESKAKIKSDKQKLRDAAGKAGGNGTTNNNLIVADRNEIMQALLNAQNKLEDGSEDI